MKRERKRRLHDTADDLDLQSFAPEGPAFTDDAWQQDTEAAFLPIEEEKIEPYSIFKPRVKPPNFILSVLVNAVRILAVLVLVGGLALVGAVVGIAKGYVETAPTLDLTALDDQAQTSFIYDANGKLITEYKGIENRVMVARPLWRWRTPASTPTTASTSSASWARLCPT